MVFFSWGIEEQAFVDFEGMLKTEINLKWSSQIQVNHLLILSIVNFEILIWSSDSITQQGKTIKFLPPSRGQ